MANSLGLCAGLWYRGGVSATPVDWPALAWQGGLSPSSWRMRSPARPNEAEFRRGATTRPAPTMDDETIGCNDRVGFGRGGASFIEGGALRGGGPQRGQGEAVSASVLLTLPAKLLRPAALPRSPPAHPRPPPRLF